MAQSPIFGKTNDPKLSLALLREHVPNVQEGHAALNKLRESTMLSSEERSALVKKAHVGKQSQEILFRSALPLIKSIARRELSRRQMWASRISYEDLIQEASTGFIRGLLSYKISNTGSPTDFLSKWITTSMHRKIESLDQKFSIPYETIERARKIKAVRSRLLNEMGREPTDDEILSELNNSTYQQYKWNTPAKKPAQPRTGKKQYTKKHLEQADALSKYTYEVGSRDAGLQSDDGEDESFERSSVSLTIDASDIEGEIEEKDLARSQNDFFRKAFQEMRMGQKQTDIALRFFGLSPYTETQSQKRISDETGYPIRFIKTVISELSIYMPLQGGVFHKLLSGMDPYTVEALEMSWITIKLGEWPTNRKHPIPPPMILTQESTSVYTGHKRKK